jgi:hypothetical protein
MGTAIMVNLYHPCDEIDVWYVDTLEDMQAAIRQGYIPLDLIRDAFRLAVDENDLNEVAQEIVEMLEGITDADDS